MKRRATSLSSIRTGLILLSVAVLNIGKLVISLNILRKFLLAKQFRISWLFSGLPPVLIRLKISYFTFVGDEGSKN